MGATGGIVAAPIVGLFLFAAWNDIATRTIPDCIAISIAIIGLTVRAFAGIPALAISTGIAVGLFGLLVLLHARGMMGGGDVKLAAATALGLSAASTWRFVVVTTLAGGVLGVIHLVLRRVVATRPVAPPRNGTTVLHRIYAAERWRIARRGSLPYGVAIACGGIWTILAGSGG